MPCNMSGSRPFRYVNKMNTKVFIKDLTKILARKVLGLDVRLARSRKYDLQPYEYNYKWISRFMHFQNLLIEIESIDGVIVECGVGPGRSLFDFAVISTALNRPRHIYGFDTFQGIPDPISEDEKWNTRIGGFWNFSEEHVHEKLKLARLDEEFISTHITFIPGEFSHTLPSYECGPIALLHIDVDIYESYKTVLEHLYDHVVPGGIIAFDEYRLTQWPGATKAIDEFFEDKPEKIVRSSVGKKYYTVKKGCWEK